MAFLDPVFGPLLALGPLWTIIILSLVISLVVVLVYKYFTNQEEMKRLKEEQKAFREKMKALRSNPEEMGKAQKEAMQKNFQYMKHSFKATLITMLPIILIFGWMNSHLAYEPIYPGETYTVTAQFKEGVTGEVELIPDEGTELLSEAAQPINSETSWSLKSTEGEHFITIKVGEQPQQKKVLISNKLEYEQPFTRYPHSDIEQITVVYQKLRPLGAEFSLFGWQPGWLGIYIILSIVFSLVLRKVLNVY